MQIHFNGTNFFKLTQRVFSVWPVAQPIVGEMEMHSVANLATLQTPLATFFPFKKAPKPSFWESPVLPREREVLLSQRAHTPLSLSLSLSLRLLSFCSARSREEQRRELTRADVFTRSREH